MAKQSTLTTAEVSVETGSTSLGTASIKSKNSSHIVQVLVNTMYANKEASSVREILSNAIDAQNMSKNTKDKIEIQVPTKTFPMLKIRDFGPGLSPEYMSNEYLSLGHSEKRDRNDAVGFMGLGRFALFSLFKNYFITSYFNGKKYPYSVHLDKTGDIALELIEDEIEETTEKNGVEVFVLIEDESRMVNFYNEILKLTFFCKNKVSLVNLDEDELPEWYNAEPVYVIGNYSVYEKTSDLSKVFNIHHYYSGVVGVYDNIPYTVGQEFQTQGLQQLQALFNSNVIIALTLPIGSVERTASREGLERDKHNKTITALNQIALKAVQHSESFKRELVKDVKELNELASVCTAYYRVFNSQNNISWKNSKGRTHVVNSSGFVSEVLRTDIQAYCLERNGRLKSLDAGVNNWRTVKYNPKEYAFVKLDVEERDVVWKSKIKNYLVSNKNIKYVYMFQKTSEEIEDFLEEVETLKVSELEKPVTQKVEKDKEIMCFHMMTENYSSYNNYSFESWNKNPDFFKDCIVIYFPYKQRVLEGTPEFFQTERNGFYGLSRFLKEYGGVVNVEDGKEKKQIPKIFLCGLSERNVEQVKGRKDFYSWEKFEKVISKLVPLQEHHFNTGLKGFFNSINSKIEQWKLICDHKDFADETFKKTYQEMISKRVNDNARQQATAIPDYVLALYKNNSSETLDRVKAQYKFLDDRMSNDYPLTAAFSYSFGHYVEDIVLYINAKLATKAKDEKDALKEEIPSKVKKTKEKSKAK